MLRVERVAPVASVRYTTALRRPLPSDKRILPAIETLAAVGAKSARQKPLWSRKVVPALCSAMDWAAVPVMLKVAPVLVAPPFATTAFSSLSN